KNGLLDIIRINFDSLRNLLTPEGIISNATLRCGAIVNAFAQTVLDEFRQTTEIGADGSRRGIYIYPQHRPTDRKTA
ncbi:MAG TPA: hypothetical protein PLZ84_06650, partial [Clostridia bacterium]|nr:hypothetical protein [Clostridia bacterium]